MHSGEGIEVQLFWQKFRTHFVCTWPDFIHGVLLNYIEPRNGQVLQSIPEATAEAGANAMCPSNYFIAIVFYLSITVIIFSDTGTARRLPCMRCSTIEECNMPPPQLCVWGENRDSCGRRVCSKGPGEKCGDKYNILGTCGEGMWCSNRDNRCHGCFIPTMTCYPD